MSAYSAVAQDYSRGLGRSEAAFETVNEGAPRQGGCPAGESVGVEVSAVPIVVESTTDDYFVLYVEHDLNADTTVDVPVSVTLGGDGTTTLAENVAALPAERYRVEKYLVSDPADVDGDCTDDVTELADLGAMNPLNPAAAVELSDGAVAIADRDTFERLAVSSHRLGGVSSGYLKFVLVGMDTDRPSIHFMNTQTHPTHQLFMEAVGIDRTGGGVISGDLTYDTELVAPDGS